MNSQSQNLHIPSESRLLVETRDLMHCVRCAGPGYEWHHRRSRRVRAEHRHCACNGVLLCRSCHRWAHAEPEAARKDGLVVSQWVDEPLVVPLRNFWGWWQNTCDGKSRPLTEQQIATDGVGGFVVSLEVHPLD